MLVIILGKSGIGKTNLQNMLSDIIEPYKLYTTRPKRKENEDGYIFVSDDEFDKLEREHKIKYSKNYTVYNGDIWKYGIDGSKLKPHEKYSLAISPEMCYYFLGTRSLKENIMIIYLVGTNKEQLYSRSINRGDEEEEIERRYISDEEQFNTYIPLIKTITDKPTRSFVPIVLDDMSFTEHYMHVYKKIIGGLLNFIM